MFIKMFKDLRGKMDKIRENFKKEIIKIKRI